LTEPLLRDPHAQRDRRPARGYLMITAAAILFAVNGAVSKVILAHGVSSARLAEVRSTGAFLVLVLALLIFRPHALRIGHRELAFLASFGVGGLAAVQLFYFLAIHRLAIGIALLLQYLAPLLVALWARYVLHEPVRRRIWAALALALVGLALTVQVWKGLALDSAGVAYALLAAVAYAVYVLQAERAVARRDPFSVSCYGFLFAALLWAVVQPWWSFPGDAPGRDASLLGHLSGLHLPVWALMTWMVLLGTIAPFALVVMALREISATRVGIVAMLEPVAGTIVAYAWLGESLGGVQAAGGAVVLAGILLAQTAR
jgi:drug/metabolite transporter (DMT)-like permease